MLEVRCYDASEIRMGSPFNVCRLRLRGPWVPELPENDWQDVFAMREDGAAVALVRWDVPGNVPGFRIWVVDEGQRMVHISERLPGCCEGLRWQGPTAIHWTSFPDLSGTYEVPAAGPAS